MKLQEYGSLARDGGGGNSLPQTALQEYVKPNKLECRLSESKPIRHLKKY